MSLDHKSWSGPFQRNAALCTRTIWVKNLHVGGQHLFREVGSFLWWTDNIPGQTPVHIIAPKGRKVLNILSSFVCISPLAKLSLASYWPSSHALRIDTQPAFLDFINCLSIKSKTRILWSSGETARPPPIYAARVWFQPGAMCGLSCSACSEGFSPGFPVFLPAQKPTYSNRQFAGPGERTCRKTS